MKEIYTVTGSVNKGFIGQISYNICLDEELSELEIDFEFDKQKVDNITNEIRKDLIDYGFKEYGKQLAEDEIRNLSRGLKTEIQIAAFMNDSFIGGIHKQLTKRKLYISSTEVSEGCIPQKSIKGVIKINIIVFNVIYNNTSYKLTLKGKSEENINKNEKENLQYV